MKGIFSQKVNFWKEEVRTIKNHSILSGFGKISANILGGLPSFGNNDQYKSA